jgi:hypothetical protein
VPLVVVVSDAAYRLQNPADTNGSFYMLLVERRSKLLEGRCHFSLLIAGPH